jgi:hypothetical protein
MYKVYVLGKIVKLDERSFGEKLWVKRKRK